MAKLDNVEIKRNARGMYIAEINLSYVSGNASGTISAMGATESEAKIKLLTNIEVLSNRLKELAI
jgi:hypothetical protein